MDHRIGRGTRIVAARRLRQPSAPHSSTWHGRLPPGGGLTGQVLPTVAALLGLIVLALLLFVLVARTALRQGWRTGGRGRA
jgi:hypothetical protein